MNNYKESVYWEKLRYGTVIGRYRRGVLPFVLAELFNFCKKVFFLFRLTIEGFLVHLFNVFI